MRNRGNGNEDEEGTNQAQTRSQGGRAGGNADARRTRTNKDHAGRGVHGLDVVDEVVALDALNVVDLTQDRQTERGALERGRVEVIEDDLVEVALDALLLLQDDAALSLRRI